jgi:G protein-coupled receptor 107
MDILSVACVILANLLFDFSYKDIFKVVDIICCGAVLIPIIWSIKHLREASQIDGKGNVWLSTVCFHDNKVAHLCCYTAARNLQKLKLFRQFYLIVVSYIYFTRIIIYLLDATLPFKLVWMGEMFSELAALCFFSIVGYV